MRTPCSFHCEVTKRRIKIHSACKILAIFCFSTFGLRTTNSFGLSSFECPPCEVTSCTPIGDCPQGITWDVCHCCETCTKTLGQECGGPWNAYGECSYGLVCFKDARECPFLFHPRRTPNSQEADACKDYLFKAIGRCLQDTSFMNSVFKRFGFRSRELSPNSAGEISETLQLEATNKLRNNGKPVMPVRVYNKVLGKKWLFG